MTDRSAPAPAAPASPEAGTAGAVASRRPSSAPLGRALRWLVHGLLYLLVLITTVSAVRELPTSRAVLLVGVLLALVSVYSIGARRQAVRTRDREIDAEPRALGHLLPTVLLWLCALVITPEAAWIVFGLDFALLYALPWAIGVPAVAAVTAIGATGYAAAVPTASAPALLGPVLAAVVAVAVIGAVRALQAEIRERERLTGELLAAQARLARHEREAAIGAERDRIARDLHDTVAQSALSIRMMLDAARSADPGPRRDALLEEARAAASRTSDQARSVLDESADRITGAELPARLQEAIDAMVAGGPTEGVLRCAPAAEVLDRLSPRTVRGLLRLVQALVANAVQHADASRVVVSLETERQMLLLDVVDDGVGLSPAAEDGFGLRAARARVRSLGGRLTLESEPGRGCAVQVTLPVPTHEIEEIR